MNCLAGAPQMYVPRPTWPESCLRIRVRRKRWQRWCGGRRVGRQFAAGGDAVAGAKFAGMDQGAELVAQLNVQRDVAFGL